MGSVLRHTKSLCPVCLRVIEAELVGEHDEVLMRKTCPAHGRFELCVWRGSVESWKNWDGLSLRSPESNRDSSSSRLCPLECGLCPDHATPACFVIVEVTSRCNLGCAVCFADASDTEVADPSLEELAEVFESAIRSEGVTPSLQLSGGEPTIRDDLPSIIALAKESGFRHVVLDTNGIRIGSNREYLKRLAQAGLDTLYLQFDGVTDGPFVTLRGRPLFNDKMRAIDNCRLEGVGVILVPTVAKGVNMQQVGDIIRLAVENMPTVRGIMFQPISMFGRYPRVLRDSGRITMPEILDAIEKQTGGMMRVDDFVPTTSGRWCEPHCSFFCFTFKSGDTLLPMTRFPTTEQIQDILSRRGDLDDRGILGLIKEYWKHPESQDQLGCCSGSETTASPDCLTISGMLFQDAWNVDVQRLKKCCIHVATLDKKLIPFCAYNITAEDGTTIYRGHDAREKDACSR